MSKFNDLDGFYKDNIQLNIDKLERAVSYVTCYWQLQHKQEINSR